MNEWQKLIDRRLEIKLQMERLEEELKSIDEEIKTEAGAGELLLGSEGYGYRLHQQETYVYPPETVDYLEKRGLLKEFVKVSTTGLEKLKKAKILSEADLDLLKAKAEVKTTLIIKSYVPEEAKII